MPGFSRGHLWHVLRGNVGWWVGVSAPLECVPTFPPGMDGGELGQLSHSSGRGNGNRKSIVPSMPCVKPSYCLEVVWGFSPTHAQGSGEILTQVQLSVVTKCISELPVSMNLSISKGLKRIS